MFGSDSLTGKGGSSLSAFSQKLLGERPHSSPVQDYIEASLMLQYSTSTNLPLPVVTELPILIVIILCAFAIERMLLFSERKLWT